MTPELIVTVRCAADHCQTPALQVYRIAESGRLAIMGFGNGVHARREGVLVGATPTGTRRVLRPRDEAKKQPPSFALLGGISDRDDLLADCTRHGARRVVGKDLIQLIARSNPKQPGQMFAVDVEVRD